MLRSRGELARPAKTSERIGWGGARSEERGPRIANGEERAVSSVADCGYANGVRAFRASRTLVFTDLCWTLAVTDTCSELDRTFCPPIPSFLLLARNTLVVFVHQLSVIHLAHGSKAPRSRCTCLAIPSRLAHSLLRSSLLLDRSRSARSSRSLGHREARCAVMANRSSPPREDLVRRPLGTFTSVIVPSPARPE